jgi:hypothetical protein
MCLKATNLVLGNWSATLLRVHLLQVKVAIKGNSNGNSVRYEATTDCDQLTPSFEKIGQ